MKLHEKMVIEGERLLGQKIHGFLNYTTTKMMRDTNHPITHVTLHPFASSCLQKYLGGLQRDIEVAFADGKVLLNFPCGQVKVETFPDWRERRAGFYMLTRDDEIKHKGDFPFASEIEKQEPNQIRKIVQEAKSRAQSFCDELEKL